MKTNEFTKCKYCKNWKAWDNGNAWWGGCSVLNDRTFVYPEVEDCMDVSARTAYFYNNSHADFCCIKFKKI